jgi:hypothetical protein
MNVEKTNATRVSRQLYPLQIMIDQKQLENVECFNGLDSMISNNARCTREIKSRIVWKKQNLAGRRFFSPANWT